MKRAVVAVALALVLAPGVARADEPEIVYAVPPASDAPVVPRATSSPLPTSGTKIRGVVTAGGSAAEVLGLGSRTVHADVGFGIDRPRLFAPLLVDVQLGSSPNGLAIGEIKLGGAIQAVLGPARLGGGVELGYAWIGRTTPAGGIVGSFVADAFALASLDAVSLGDRRAVFVALKPSVGMQWGDDVFAFGHAALAWRGTAMAGVRF